MEKLWEECQEYMAQLEMHGECDGAGTEEMLFSCTGNPFYSSLSLDCFSLAVAPRDRSCRDAGGSQELWNPLGIL